MSHVRMSQRLVVLATAIFITSPAFCLSKVQVPCAVGGKVVVINSGLSSTTKVLASYPHCTIRVNITGGTTKAAIYSDSSSTPLANPFTADANGFGFFFVADGTYDIILSGGDAPSLPSPYTYGAVNVIDTSTEPLTPASPPTGFTARLKNTKLLDAVNILDFGAACDGTTSDTNAFINALTFISSNGGGTLLLPRGGTCALSPAAVGYSQQGIPWSPNVNLDGQNATLKLLGNSDFIDARSGFINGHSQFQDTTTITSNVNPGDSSFTVASAANLSIGQRVYIRILGDPQNPGQVLYHGFWTISNLVGTTVTLNGPLNLPYEMVVGSTASSERQLRYFPNGYFHDISFKNLRMVQGSGSAEVGIFCEFCENVVFENIECENCGTGALIIDNVTNVTAHNIRVPISVQQGGQASKGGCLEMAETDTADIGPYTCEQFEGTPFEIEAATYGTHLHDILINDNSSTRNRALTKIPFVLEGGWGIEIQNVRLEGAGPLDMLEVNPGMGNNPSVEFKLTGSWVLNSNNTVVNPIALERMAGSVMLGAGFGAVQGMYNTRRTYSTGMLLPQNTDAITVNLPNGICTNIRVYVSSTTGLTHYYLGNSTGPNNTDIASVLVSNKSININAPIDGGPSSNGSICGLGSGYVMNLSSTGHQAQIYTGSSTAGAYTYVVMDYLQPELGYPSPTATTQQDDGAKGQIQVVAPTPNMYTIPTSGSPVVDPGNGPYQYTVIGNGADNTPSFTNAPDGTLLTLLLCQNGSGFGRWAWPSNVYGGNTINLSANRCISQSFIWKSNNAYAIDRNIHLTGSGDSSFVIEHPGGGSGTGSSTVITGTDSVHLISLTTGTGPSPSTSVMRVNTTNRWLGSSAPMCVLASANGNAAALSGNAQVYVNAAATSPTSYYEIYVGSTPLSASTVYKWWVHCGDYTP
jgi:hypothetical protein